MAASQMQAAYQFVVKQSAALRCVPVSVCCCNLSVQSLLRPLQPLPCLCLKGLKHTVQNSEMHSHALFQPCLLSWHDQPLVFASGQKLEESGISGHCICCLESRAVALPAQIALRPLWLVHIRWTAIAGI